MTKTISIQQGSHVKLHVRMTLDNGFVVQDTVRDEPLEITIGKGELDPALEKVLLGLKANETKHFEFAAGDVFGFRDQANIHELGREQFSQFTEAQLREGVILGFDTPSGEQVPGMIVAVSEKSLTVDFNHPLAGRAFSLDVEVLSVD